MGLYVMSRSITEMGIGGRLGNGSRDSCLSMLDDHEKVFLQGDNKVVIEDDKKKNNGCFFYSSSSDSSIGKDSDEEIENDNDDEEEVQSSFKKKENGSFDSLQALEEALPTRKGMSRFFNGKTKSFTRLSDASLCSSINELAKPENIYRKRRRNSLAKSLIVDKHNSSQLKSSGRVSKKSKFGNSMQGTAVAVAMTNSDTIENLDSKPTSISSLCQHYSQRRQAKFINSCCTSFADLEQCASLETSAPL